MYDHKAQSISEVREKVLRVAIVAKLGGGRCSGDGLARSGDQPVKCVTLYFSFLNTYVEFLAQYN